MQAMKAVVMRMTGGPEVLQIEEVPVPEPAPDEVLVRVQAVGVSYHDVVQRNGTMRRHTHLPMIPGYEISGIVERAGALVRGLAPGDAICTKAFASCGLCRFCRTGMETSCLSRRPVHGGYAEFVALPGEACLPVPPGMDPAIACMLGATTGVALNAVRDVGALRLGESVLVTGASGGVGLAAVEIARLCGGRVIALTRSAAREGTLRAAGADEVVVAGEGAPFWQEVQALTGGAGVDLVVDTVGSRVFKAAFRSLAPGGRYALVGQLFAEEISINPAFIFFQRARLLGVGSVRRDQLEDAVRLVAEGRLAPRVAARLPLEGVQQAHRMVEAGAEPGRVVLEVSRPMPEA